MGFFTGIKDTYKKSEAATVVQNLLEMQAGSGFLTLDPAQCAAYLVMSAWDEKPDIFSGKFGQRPHKLAVAAFALARGLLRMRKDDMNRGAILASLWKVLSEAEANAGFYPFNNLDTTLLNAASEVLVAKAEEMNFPE